MGNYNRLLSNDLPPLPVAETSGTTVDEAGSAVLRETVTVNYEWLDWESWEEYAIRTGVKPSKLIDEATLGEEISNG